MPDPGVEKRTEAARRLDAAVRQADAAEAERLIRTALALLGRRGQRLEPPLEALPVSRKFFAEFLGTLWLVLGGCGAAVLAAKFPEVGIGLLGVAFAFGLTVLTGAYTFGHISGGHFNPAVTIGLAAARRIRFVEVPLYVIAQVLGAIAGAAILYVVASGAAGFSLDGGFASNGYGDHSPGHYSLGAAIVIEFAMTFFFLTVILGTTSARASKGFAALAIGLSLTLIHLISIPVTNTSVNPARSTGPALFVGGWALEQLWLFWVVPIVGATVAGLLHLWLGADDSAIDRAEAVRLAALEKGEPLAPREAREPR